MTHEEAISILKNTAWLGSVDDLEKVEEALQYFDDIESSDRKCIGIGTQNVSESDSISRQAAIEAIFNEPLWESGMKEKTAIAVVLAIYKKIKSLPSAQPDIIRRKDCENWDKTWTNDFPPNHYYCPVIDGVRDGNFYCGDAERREDERSD